MSRSRTDEVLRDWDAVARHASRPSPPIRVTVGGSIPGLGARGALVLLGVAVIVLAGLVLRSTTIPTGAPASAFGPLVEQTDGLNGYRMLRPVDWHGFSGDGRGYVSSEGSDHLALIVRNYGLMPSSSSGMVLQRALFDQSPTLEGWTAALEHSLTTSWGMTLELERALPAARIYWVLLPDSSGVVHTELDAYTIAGGTPYGIALSGMGEYTDLRPKLSSATVDDFARIVGSLEAIPIDPTNVQPPLGSPQPSSSESPTSSQRVVELPPVVLRPATGQTPSTGETERAVAVLTARLQAVAPGAFTISSGDTISITFSAPVDEAAVQAVLSTTGQAEFVPLPPARYGSVNGPGLEQAVAGQPLPTDEKALFGSEGIASAADVTDSNGPAIDITLSADAARLFADYTSTHVGDYFALVLDGTVLSAPYIKVPMTGGSVGITGPFTDAMPVDALAAILSSGPLPTSWAQRR